MSFRDILAPVLSLREDEAALSAAEVVAGTYEARIRALLVEVKPPPIYTLEGVLNVTIADALAQEQLDFAAETARLEERAGKRPNTMSVSTLSVVPDKLGSEVGALARCADLTVTLSPRLSWRKYYRMPMFDGILFGSGRPVLLIPPDWRQGSIGRNIIVAANGSREAARAVADAAPFLERADQVIVVTIGPGARELDFDLKASNDIVAHLARRGIEAEAHGVEDFNGNEGGALLTEAVVREADLIVMGGYGHSRLGESIFGGVTREAIEFASIPVLMSH